jgi:hypothetical protein
LKDGGVGNDEERRIWWMDGRKDEVKGAIKGK